MSSHSSIGFIGFSPEKAKIASALQLHLSGTTRVYDTSSDSAELYEAGQVQRSDSVHHVAQHSQIIWIEEKDAEALSEMLLGSCSGLIHSLPKDASLILECLTQPDYYQDLASRLAKAGRPDIKILDCSVIAPSSRTKSSIWISGSKASLKSVSFLSEAHDNVHVISGGLGAANKLRLTSCLLEATHTVTAAEATGLASKAGIDANEIYSIIINAAGNSSAYEELVPHMLQGDSQLKPSIESLLHKFNIVTSSSKSLNFPLPLCSASEQVCLLASAQGYALQHVSSLVKLFKPQNEKPTSIDSTGNYSNKTSINVTPPKTPPSAATIGMVGLGAMGQGMAQSLVRAGFSVQGYDVWAPSVEKFAASGPSGMSIAATSPADAAKGTAALILMVQNAVQAWDVLFGAGKAAKELSDGATVILSSTVPPSEARRIGDKLESLDRGLSLVDAPVSGGVARAAKGDLTMICSGTVSALSSVRGIILAMAGKDSNIYNVKGGVGAASSAKLINQLLAGVHIATAAEALSFASRLGLDTRQVYDIFNDSPAWSWMFQNRATQMLDADWTPHSALAIFVKDLGIVLNEAKRLASYTPMSAVAHTLYIDGAARGWARESDAGVVRLWEVAGSDVSKSASAKVSPPAAACEDCVKPLAAKSTFAAFPAECTADLIESTKARVDSGAMPVLIALDDDPTGTQTCNNIDVLAVWDVDTLKEQFATDCRGFFILTNSRALPPTEAKELIIEITTNVKKAAEESGKAFEIVLRGDSTLRGHLPEEPEAVEQVLGKSDGWVFAPFFRQGGRFTIDDVHYVQEDDTLIPAAQTSFAKDATFGYKSSDLREYILEKCGSRFTASSFTSITLEDLRCGGPAKVEEKLLSGERGADRVIIVNAVADSDMNVFVAGLLAAEEQGYRFIYRTAAAFVSSRLGIKEIPPKTWAEVSLKADVNAPRTGGLILAGSYVPKTTAQLKALRERRGADLEVIELDVAQLIESAEQEQGMVDHAISETTRLIGAGKDVLVMTSRTLIKTDEAISSLKIGSKVAAALVRLLVNIQVRPRYIIAKGGITSSDAATKGLKMRRALIVGQAAPGVPLWRCDEETSRHRSVPFVVFPGNVGSETTLAEIVEQWAL
ncbi:3-hydroxyisobutyrate dehydrogenase [Fusarium tjaetaba]|uniref:3-hydroxyisobutyrate dehydrogenase n=1 Tax=Fusarium tjaetaba TaxID=1567544 RepID=A0A8H5VT56_9HYPO|nr:3-hydroxyisobutyrate dehydrogenase [Fusarium tjaetaba]KAF5632404.1 3-hydroxyisobutyrate dehydrogenase [Fusarium tjaetaba]